MQRRATICPGSVTRVLLGIAALAGAGCAGGPPRPAPEIAPSSISPALGVNLAEYTRTTEGLYYLDVRAGDGDEARPGSNVTVSYRLLLANGTQVDSAANLPIRLARDPIIKGWKLGIPGMRVGGARILVIPPELGYGWQQAGAVPPNSTLIFRVQLMAVR